MIEPELVFSRIVEACPSFGGVLAESILEWGAELRYQHAGAFCRHLLSLYRSGRVEELARAGQVIERLYSEGTQDVITLVTTGIIETIQNGWSNCGADPEHFFVYLGPTGRRSWQEVNAGWGGAAQPVVQPEVPEKLGHSG